MRQILWLAGAVVSLWIACAALLWSTFRAEWEVRGFRASLAHAELLIQQGMLEKGLAAMQAVSVPDRFPLDKARRHHNCGVVLLQLRQPGAAAQHLLLALKYDSADAQAAYLLATMAAEMGRLDEARLLVDLALSIEPQFAPASRLQQRLHEIGPMTEKALTRPGP